MTQSTAPPQPAQLCSTWLPPCTAVGAARTEHTCHQVKHLPPVRQEFPLGCCFTCPAPLSPLKVQPGPKECSTSSWDEAEGCPSPAMLLLTSPKVTLRLSGQTHQGTSRPLCCAQQPGPRGVSPAAGKSRAHPVCAPHQTRRASPQEQSHKEVPFFFFHPIKQK